MSALKIEIEIESDELETISIGGLAGDGAVDVIQGGDMIVIPLADAERLATAIIAAAAVLRAA